MEAKLAMLIYESDSKLGSNDHIGQIPSNETDAVNIIEHTARIGQGEVVLKCGTTLKYHSMKSFLNITPNLITHRLILLHNADNPSWTVY